MSLPSEAPNSGGFKKIIGRIVGGFNRASESESEETEYLRTKTHESLKSVQVSTVGLSDTPADKDDIGFQPYVRAMAWFLLNDSTRPPLTVSIEGPWGSGKSSFMLQLALHLRTDEEGKKRGNRYVVEFNAWRSDKDEALWAAFALAFIRQLERDVSFLRRQWANLSLQWRRIDWTRGKWQIFQLAIFILLVGGFSVIGVRYQSVLKINPTVASILGVAWLGTLGAALIKARRVFGNPLSWDLGRYIRNPGYEEKVAFIERFQSDFADIVGSYVGKDGRVYIFIDDLDRCEVPRAADLMQAVNLLLATDQANLFFILGLDREMVAAGLGAKNEKILPYLAAGRREVNKDADGNIDKYKVGIDYGYAYLEKFIQVPFRVPQPDDARISSWVATLANTKERSVSATESSGAGPNRSQSTTSEFMLASGKDPEGFEDVVKKMAEVFDFNPRRIKQFINVFRLRVAIALTTRVLAPAQKKAARSAAAGGISLEQLGLFTAVLLRWPQIISDLIVDTDLISRLSGDDRPKSEDGAADGIKSHWAADDKLMRALSLKAPYSLLGIDIKPLLMVLPNAYFGEMGLSDSTQRAAQLVPGLGEMAGRGVEGQRKSEKRIF